MLKIIKHLCTGIIFTSILPCAAFAIENGIEGLRSQNYSIGILIFLFISMGVFVGVIRLFYKHTDMTKVKTGEKVLMGMIVFGVVIAGIFAVTQLVDGYLF